MIDEILTKEQFREIIEYLPIQGKAITLFLANTGARMGTALQLGINDLNLDVDPAYADIPVVMPRARVRRVYFNRESVDAINNWLKTREGNYNDLVFGIKVGSFARMWSRALDKVGLDERDEKARPKFHVHSIRKWFFTQMEMSGMPEAFIRLLIGLRVDTEQERPTEEEVREEYIKHRDAVTIYEE